jgi:hypothetical protein
MVCCFAHNLVVGYSLSAHNSTKGFAVPNFVLAVLDEKDKEGFTFAWRTAANLHAEFAYSEDRYWAMLHSAQFAPDEISLDNFWRAAHRYKLRLDKASEHLTRLKSYINTVVDVAFKRMRPIPRVCSSDSIIPQHSSLSQSVVITSC